MNDKVNLTVSSGPHISSGESINKIMYTVILALVPAILASIYYFDIIAIWLILACSLGTIGTEVIAQKLRGVSVTISDGSALLTGILLALTLPPTLPIWMAILGSIVAIALGKHAFGGLGYNIFNPALIGRAFIALAYTEEMTTWTPPEGMPVFLTQILPMDGIRESLGVVDIISNATPLAKEGVGVMNMFVGRIGGSLGETSALALLLGGLYLLYKGYIDWRIPLGYLGSVALLTTFLGESGPLFHLFAGGLMLGAFFMATDMVTSPVTKKGRWVFGIGCGFILVIIRIYGNYSEGVLFSILLMNMIVPIIDKYTLPRVFGEVKADV